jgi:hypothetical protein
MRVEHTLVELAQSGDCGSPGYLTVPSSADLTGPSSADLTAASSADLTAVS